MAKKAREKEKPAEVAVVGELYEEGQADIIRSLLDVPHGEEVVIYIDCAGGSVYAALAITALLRIRKLKATAIVIGECSSSAILIFAACPKRFVTPRSAFLFHRVKWRSEKDVRSEEAANWASHFHWLEQEVDLYQAKLLGGSYEQFARWINEGRFVLGRELAELGYAQIIDV
jgi:ATP-dependent protease ClpP protease subunit